MVFAETHDGWSATERRFLSKSMEQLKRDALPGSPVGGGTVE